MVSQAAPTSKSATRRHLIITATGTLLLVAVCYGSWKIFGFALPCVFHELTGWYCPGCGISRMLLALVAGDFYQAFRYNPLLFILLPGAMVLAANWFYAELSGRKSWVSRIPEWLWIGLAIVIVLYGALRNVPALSFLAPTLVE